MQSHFKARLGLSATPERLFDEDGSAALKEFFGEEPVFVLGIGSKVKLNEGDTKETPIIGKFLSNYTYDFKIAPLE